MKQRHVGEFSLVIV